MKKILKLLVVIIFLTTTACDDNLDINTNPNTPQNVDKKFVLTAAEGSIATIIGGNLTNFAGFMTQYHTQSPGAGQYTNIDTYNVNADYANRLWAEIYAGGLNDLEFVISESKKDGDTGTELIATLLKVYTFQVLTDLFGDIPFSEALQGDSNISPVSDSGEVIYENLIAMIDQGLSDYNANSVQSSVGRQDNIYNANMNDWIKFANTLKLKLYMRMSYTSKADATAVMALINQDNFITSDAKFSAYDGEINKSNPFYDVQIDRLGDVNNIASNSLLSFYQENLDPRLGAVYRLNNEDIFRGIDQGDRDNSAINSATAQDFSRPNITATTPVHFMTVAESYFLQAEALIRYANGAGAAAKYNAGITASFSTYGLSGADALPLYTAGGKYEFIPNADVETAVKQVMIQKWASLAYINNIEAFFEVRRTKFPETVAFGSQDYPQGNLIASLSSILSGTLTPNTLFYPDNEVDRNTNLTQKTSLLEKIWWDQK